MIWLNLSQYGSVLPVKSAAKPLDRASWVAAGLARLRRDGIGAVRVELLARDLGVSKGSFYWHFAKRSELLTEILAAWRRSDTTAMIEAAKARGGSPQDRLWTLFEFIASSDHGLERAVRGWAATDAAAADSLAQVDRRRLAYLEDLFAAMGFDAPDAGARAGLAYASVVGEAARGTPIPLAERLRHHRLLVSQIQSRP